VRTTVNIDDHLLAQAKVVAARGHRSLGDVINDALRYALVERVEGTRPGQRVVLPVDGGSGLQPGIDLEDKGSLAAALGDDAPVRAPS
jgi:plasmid stability protein